MSLSFYQLKISLLGFLICMVSKVSVAEIKEVGPSSNYPKFNSIKKVTVGPDDQLDGSLSAAGDLLVFTHKINLMNHIKIQNLKTGEVRDLLKLGADSNQPRFNKQGQLVFVFFKRNSRGDICYSLNKIKFENLPISDSEMSCLYADTKDNHRERFQPFWLNEGEIGFLERANEKNVNLVS